MSALDWGGGTGANATPRYYTAPTPQLPNGPWAIGGWLRRSSITGSSLQKMFGIGVNSTPDSIYFFIGETSSGFTIGAEAVNSAGTTLINATGGGAPTQDGFDYLWCITRDGSGNINGYLVREGGTAAAIITASGATGTIAADSGARLGVDGSFHFAGPFGDFFIFDDRGLSNTELTALARGVDICAAIGTPKQLLRFRNGAPTTEANAGTGGTAYDATKVDTGFTETREFFPINERATGNNADQRYVQPMPNSAMYDVASWWGNIQLGIEKWFADEINVVSGSGQFITLTADALVTTPVLSKVDNAIRSASTAAAAALVKTASAIRSASSALTATLVRQTQKPLTAALTLTATVLRQQQRTLSATALVLTAAKTAVAGAVRSASSATSATLVKQAQAIRSAAATLVATVVTSKVKVTTLTATALVTTATLIRQAKLIKDATVVTTATVQKAVSATRSSTMALVATLAVLRQKTLTAVVGATATLVKQAQFTVSAAMALSAIVGRLFTFILTASPLVLLADIGETIVKLTTLSTSVTMVATSLRSALLLRAFSAVSTPVAAVVKQTQLVRLAVISQAIIFAKSARVIKAASVAAIATIAKLPNKVVAATVGLVATVGRALVKVLSTNQVVFALRAVRVNAAREAVVTTVTALVKRAVITKTSATVTVAAAAIGHLIKKTLLAFVDQVGFIAKRPNKVMTATLSFVAALIRFATIVVHAFTPNPSTVKVKNDEFVVNVQPDSTSGAGKDSSAVMVSGRESSTIETTGTTTVVK